jgi:hypothetical protein
VPKDNIALEQLHFLRIQRYFQAVRETEDRTLLKKIRGYLTTIKEERLRIDARLRKGSTILPDYLSSGRQHCRRPSS